MMSLSATNNNNTNNRSISPEQETKTEEEHDEYEELEQTEGQFDGEVDMSIAKSIMCCVCDVSIHEDTLYLCQFADCPRAKKLYCLQCGIASHRRLKSHKFEDTHIQGLQLQQFQQKILDGKNMVKYTLSERREMTHEVPRSLFENGAYAVSAINAPMSMAIDGITKGVAKGVWTRILSLIKVGNCSAAKESLQVIGWNAVDMGLESAKHIREGAFMASFVVCSLEIAYHSYRYYKGDIDWKMYGRNVVRSTATSVSAGAGNIGGAAMGAAIGSFVGPVGTFFGALIGGIIGSLISYSGAKKLFDDYVWPDPTQRQREILVREALAFFNYVPSDVCNPVLFNEHEVMKQYRVLSLKMHPDRIGGSIEKFHTLSAYLGIMMSLLEKDEQEKKEDVHILKQLTL